MSKLRQRILKADENPDEKKFTLDDYEWSYLKDMNSVLIFHTLRSNLISNFLTYVAKTRLGYTNIREGYALQYELDLQSDDHTLIVREVPKPAEDSLPTQSAED